MRERWLHNQLFTTVTGSQRQCNKTSAIDGTPHFQERRLGIWIEREALFLVPNKKPSPPIRSAILGMFLTGYQRAGPRKYVQTVRGASKCARDILTSSICVEKISKRVLKDTISVRSCIFRNQIIVLIIDVILYCRQCLLEQPNYCFLRRPSS